MFRLQFGTCRGSSGRVLCFSRVRNLIERQHQNHMFQGMSSWSKQSFSPQTYYVYMIWNQQQWPMSDDDPRMMHAWRAKAHHQFVARNKHENRWKWEEGRRRRVGGGHGDGTKNTHKSLMGSALTPSINRQCSFLPHADSHHAFFFLLSFALLGHTCIDMRSLWMRSFLQSASQVLLKKLLEILWLLLSAATLIHLPPLLRTFYITVNMDEINKKLKRPVRK